MEGKRHTRTMFLLMSFTSRAPSEKSTLGHSVKPKPYKASRPKDDVEEIRKQYEEANNSVLSVGVEIPEMFKELDSDKDKYISAKEVTNAIDGFFEGANNLSAKDLNTLIDFYFDQ